MRERPGSAGKDARRSTDQLDSLILPRSKTDANGRKSLSRLFSDDGRDEHRSGSDALALQAATSLLAQKERQSAYDDMLTRAIWDLATTGANPAIDLLVCLERRQTIGFRYVDINRAVVIHHGSRDTRVPVENVRWLGKTMRRCEVRVLEGEGHALMASAAVMSSVLMEVAKEWEDWMKVVQQGRGTSAPTSTNNSQSKRLG